MENYSYHVPFYVVTGGIATSGHSADLTAGKVGLYDRSTFSVATAIGNGKEFFFAQGAIGGFDWYGQPITQSHKSPFFEGKNVENMYLSKPQRVRNEEWVIGYNGSPSSVSLKYVTGESIRIKFYFHGEPTYRFFNGPKEYVVSYTPKEDCTIPCEADDCPDAIADCQVHTQNLIDLINGHTELKKFGVTAKFVHADFAAATPNMTKYCLTLCDNGDSTALQAVQAQAPVGSIVTRTERTGSLSTYQICISDDDAAPTAFTQTSSVLQAVCGDCPDDSFLIGAKDVFIVRRPIVGGEDFSTAATRDAYANAIWQQYATQESVTTTTSTTSTTTASGTLLNPDATFVGQDGSLAIVKLKFAEGTVLDPAIGTDQIEFSHTEAAVCVFETPASVAWTECGVGISSSRTLRLKNINRPDCDPDADRLDDIALTLAGVRGIDIESLALEAGDACMDDYTVEQASLDCLEEGCLTSNVTFTYDTLPAFENSAWEVVPVEPEEDETRQCGIRVSAGYVDPRFGNCSFNPMDYYNVEPVKMEISLLGEDWDRCDFADRPTVAQSQIGQIARQSGEYVVRELIMKTDAYLKHIDQFSLEPRMREAFDMNLLNMVDRTAFYNLYYITFRASYGDFQFRKKEVKEEFTAVFAFKEGDAAAQLFESQIVDVLTLKSGVLMHVHEGNLGGTSGMQGISSGNWTI
jgi:hypothetical protein